jgi:hypothetical protein
VVEGSAVGFCIAFKDNTNCVPLVAVADKNEIILTIFPGDTVQTGEPITAVGDVIVQGNEPLPKLYCFGKYTNMISLAYKLIVILIFITY